MKLKADLHLHSCLSPCGSLEMSPNRIVQEALKKEIDIIALTDHNSALNCPTLAILAQQSHLLAFFGLEITSREEVHLLALFGSLEKALQMGEWVYQALPPIHVDPEKYGDQVYIDEKNVIIGEIEYYLTQACQHTLEEIVHFIHVHGGLAIPSHIDRPGSGLLDNLGILLPPEKTGFDAIELSHSYWLSPSPIPNIELYPQIASSDAHCPESIGSLFTTFEMEEKSWEAFVQALKQKKIIRG